MLILRQSLSVQNHVATLRIFRISLQDPSKKTKESTPKREPSGHLYNTIKFEVCHDTIRTC